LDKEKLIRLLNQFLNKAWCTYSEQSARKLLKQVAPHIPSEYLRRIETEWQHVTLGHGIDQARMALKTEVNKFIEEKLN
jgi:hypothetical protein